MKTFAITFVVVTVVATIITAIGGWFAAAGLLTVLFIKSLTK